MTWRKNIVIVTNIIIIFTVLILTISDSEYKCEVDGAGSEETCDSAGILGGESQICQGTVFTILAKTESKTIYILCPWGPAIVTLTVLGFLAAFIYTFLAVLQAMTSISKKLVLVVSILTFPFLLASTILMLMKISDGGKKCENFEDDLSADGSEGNCSNSKYGLNLILSMIGMLIFGYQAVQGYFDAKKSEEELFSNFKDNDVYTQASSRREENLQTFNFPYDDEE